MKTCKMMFKILLNHGIAVFLSFILVLFLSFLLDHMALVSAITTLIYAALVYSAGWNQGKKDGRKLPGCEPDPKKAVRASLIFACIPLVLLIFRVICPYVFPLQWKPYGEGFTMVQTPHIVTQISDTLYRVFFFPCIGFLQSGALLNYFLPILIVPVLVPVGYIVGLRRFSITERYLPKVFYKAPQDRKAKKKNSAK